jgi:hypothetical protein
MSTQEISIEKNARKARHKNIKMLYKKIKHRLVEQIFPAQQYASSARARGVGRESSSPAQATPGPR